MASSKKMWERIEFPLAFILSMIAGLLAFTFVWLVASMWDSYHL